MAVDAGVEVAVSSMQTVITVTARGVNHGRDDCVLEWGRYADPGVG